MSDEPYQKLIAGILEVSTRTLWAFIKPWIKICYLLESSKMFDAPEADQKGGVWVNYFGFQ